MSSLAKFGGKQGILAKMYPDHPWEEAKFIHGARFAQQRQLFNTIQQLFPNYKVYEEWPSKESELSSKLVFPASGITMRFDIAIPELKLCSMFKACFFSN